MRKTTIIVIALAITLMAASNGQNKVTMCHKGTTITIAEPAVDAHIANHDDEVGPCTSEPLAPPFEEPTSTPPIVVDPPPLVGSCEEDNPCWDCETMGNMVCGPIVAHHHSSHAVASGDCLRWSISLPYCD